MDLDRELVRFNQGTSLSAYRLLGCHKTVFQGQEAYRFAVWAPNAREISVVGEFNHWAVGCNRMAQQGASGVWTAVIPQAQHGQMYKYAILAPDGSLLYKSDPYAVQMELRPGTASRVYELPSYAWTDGAYLERRKKADPFQGPMSIYEVHLGSWREALNYRELADQLVDYVSDMGYTHVELMPVSEYPLDASWGYQVTGYYAITSRYGNPEDFMYLVDRCHSRGIGVILDWVAAHFPRDAHGLRRFDGTALYEHYDPRRGEQPQWGTMLFDYSRYEVKSFLLSNASYFLEEYHIDGLRVDAVSCMLYLDYGKNHGEWVPNRYGGNENLDAIAFLQELAHAVGGRKDGSLLIAEESTAFPLITKPPEMNGLGFHFKWNMGWMNDTLSYMSLDPVYRKWHHDKLTFSLCYAFSENYILPFSHDEVVHGKRSLIGRMSGDYWQQFANLRLLYAYQFAHPGKKLMFMGGEFAQFIEWRYYEPLEWFLLEYPMHRSMQDYVRELNHFYTASPTLYQCDTGWDGFEWASVDDRDQSVLAFFRRDKQGGELLCAFNFTPVPQGAYSLGLERKLELRECLNSDSSRFGGTGDWQNPKPVAAESSRNGTRPYSVSIVIPPLGAVYFHVTDRTPQRVQIREGGDRS